MISPHHFHPTNGVRPSDYNGVRPSDYIEKFKRCLLSYLTGERQWVWTVWSNCGDFVEYAVEHCKEWSKR